MSPKASETVLTTAQLKRFDKAEATAGGAVTKKKKAFPKITSPDHKLDSGQFHALNCQFYEGFHQELITGRLGSLCLLHDTPEVVEKLLARGVSWGKLELRLDPEDGSRETLKRTAELELVALRQHAAEVLFRLFWVHGHREPCPWLALARFRAPGDLMAAIDKYLRRQMWSDEDERLRVHARAVWGSTAVDNAGVIREQLRASVQTVAHWIEAAALIVREASLYNAYKHGLAVVSSKPFNLKIEAPGSPQKPLMSMEAGPGFSYIGRRRDEVNQRYYWQRVQEPVDFPAAAAEVGTFGSLIGTILVAGALERGVTEPPQKLRVLNPELTPERVRNPEGRTGVFISRYEESLLYLK